MKLEDAKNILNIKTIQDDIKTAYRHACKKYHPDVNPAGLQMMQLINEAHDTIKRAISENWADKPASSGDIPAAMSAVLNKIIHLNGLKFEICGSWLWVTGNTRENKDTIKAAGCRYAAKKRAWYWRPEGYKKRSKKTYTLDEIRNRYGSEEIPGQFRPAIAV